MKTISFFFLLLIPLCWSGVAGSSVPAESINFNLGIHTEFYNSVQNDASGGMRKFEFSPVIGAGYTMPFYENLSFLPEINWVLPKEWISPQNDEDSMIIENLFMFRGDLGYDLFSTIRLRIGTSLMLANQQGRGGKAQMNNGNGTSTFYYPDENRSSWNNTFDVGLEVMPVSYPVSFRFQTYTYSLFKEEQRQVSYTLFLTYYWERSK